MFFYIFCSINFFRPVAADLLQKVNMTSRGLHSKYPVPRKTKKQLMTGKRTQTPGTTKKHKKFRMKHEILSTVH